MNGSTAKSNDWKKPRKLVYHISVLVTVSRSRLFIDHAHLNCVVETHLGLMGQQFSTQEIPVFRDHQEPKYQATRECVSHRVCPKLLRTQRRSQRSNIIYIFPIMRFAKNRGISPMFAPIPFPIFICEINLFMLDSNFIHFSLLTRKRHAHRLDIQSPYFFPQKSMPWQFAASRVLLRDAA